MGSTEIDWLRFILALVFTLGLLGLLAVGLRRFNFPALKLSTPNNRIEMVSALMLDARHRLVLVRLDTQEHLILLGGAQPLLVAQPMLVAQPATAAPQPFPDALLASLQRPDAS